MNWGKAKNLLLVVFVIANLLLGYLNFARPLWLLPAQAVDDEDLRVTRNSLEKANIFLLQPIPRSAPQMGNLPVKLTQQDPGTVAARFFQGQQVRAERQNGNGGPVSYQFSTGSERLDISANGVLTYRNDAINVAAAKDPIAPEQAKALADQFLSQHLGGLPKTAQAGFGDGNSGPAASQHVTYYQTYHGYPIYDAYIDLVVTAQGVALLNERWVEPLGWPSGGATVASAGDILLRLSRDLRLSQDPRYVEARKRLIQGQPNTQITVKDISLGYYTALKPDEETTAIPIWRVLFAQGDEFYFDALTGVLVYPQ